MSYLKITIAPHILLNTFIKTGVSIFRQCKISIQEDRKQVASQGKCYTLLI